MDDENKNTNVNMKSLTPDSLMKAFGEQDKKNEIAEVLKELFKESKINMITDLTSDEIRLMTRIYIIADMKKLEVWKSGLLYYQKLMLSKNRTSRKEILEAIKGYGGERGLISKLNPANWGGR